MTSSGKQEKQTNTHAHTRELFGPHIVVACLLCLPARATREVSSPHRAAGRYVSVPLWQLVLPHDTRTGEDAAAEGDAGGSEEGGARSRESRYATSEQPGEGAGGGQGKAVRSRRRCIPPVQACGNHGDCCSWVECWVQLKGLPLLRHRDPKAAPPALRLRLQYACAPLPRRHPPPPAAPRCSRGLPTSPPRWAAQLQPTASLAHVRSRAAPRRRRRRLQLPLRLVPVRCARGVCARACVWPPLSGPQKSPEFGAEESADIG